MLRPASIAPQALLAFAVALSCAPGRAQDQVKVQARGAIAAPAKEELEAGVPVEMFESPNLDRFVRRARRFLDEERYEDAIAVLQSVIEGRTLEAEPTEVEAAPEPKAADGQAPEGQAAEPADRSGQKPRSAARVPGSDQQKKDDKQNEGPVDPRKAVFSVDGRLYRPAARLCQEYLAQMPAVGIELYQARYESQAAALLDAARRTGIARDFEQVAVRHFPSQAAGLALQTLADLHMQAGRYRAAVQTLRDLVEVYPKANLQRLGISALGCRFKIALCLRLSGYLLGARDAVAQLANDHPDESLRVMGELTPVRDLPTSAWFAAPEQIAVAADAAPKAGWLAAADEPLLPLWTYRFAGNDPYEPVQGKRGNNEIFVFGGSGSGSTSSPPANKYGVGTQVAFFGERNGRAVFLENFRLRIAESLTGILMREGDGEELPPKPLEGRPRPRVPVYDLALMTPLEDADRYYAVLGYNRVTQSAEPLKNNWLVAYGKEGGPRLWSTESYAEGEDGFADVTFLAAPVRFAETLLAPVLHKGVYALQCIDRASGKPLWRTRIHAAGTRYFKAPGARVKTQGSTAYVLTNAGAFAAIDAFAGDLRWIRKYERTDPLRAKPAKRKSDGNSNPFGFSNSYVESDLPGALPSEVYEANGALVFAPCDSDLLLCVDGASGDPVWMLDGTTRYAPYGKLRYLIGVDDGLLFFEASTDLRDHLVCVEAATGIVRWSREIPRSTERLTRWPGRGCIAEGRVLLPGDRRVHSIDVKGEGAWEERLLPLFSAGEEPLRGPNNLFVRGSWLSVCYARGIETYTTASELTRLAQGSDDVEARARILVQASKLQDALDALVRSLGELGPAGDPVIAERRALQAVAIARSLALSTRDAPLVALDAIAPFVTAPKANLAWRLARVDAVRAAGDGAATEREQEALYRTMEGKQ